MSPVTPEGRAVAVALMAIGIALFGMLTAGIAAYFVEGSGREEEGVTTKALMVKLEALEARLEWQDQILQAIARDRAGDGETTIQDRAASPASPASLEDAPRGAQPWYDGVRFARRGVGREGR